MDDIARHCGKLVTERVALADTAVREYLRGKGEEHTMPLSPDDLSDLLADLYHLADSLGYDRRDMEERALMHYEGEKLDGKFWIERDLGGSFEPWDQETDEGYDSLEGAIEAIRDLIVNQINAVEAGDMSDSEDASGFRIVRDGEEYQHTSGYNYELVK